MSHRDLTTRVLRVPPHAIAAVTAVLLPLLLLPDAAGAGPPVVSFETTGGDAWTFEKPVRGHFAATACDRIVVHTHNGAVEASITGERFFAEVPLRGDANELSAACLDDGEEVARSATRHWIVRLPDVPKAWVRTRITGNSVGLDAERSEPAPATPAPIVSSCSPCPACR